MYVFGCIFLFLFGQCSLKNRYYTIVAVQIARASLTKAPNTRMFICEKVWNVAYKN